MIELSPEVATITMFIGLLIGLFMGHPLAFVLGGVATIIGFIGWGPAIMDMFVNRIFGVMDNYIIVAIPLFLFMAQVLSKAGVAEGIFETVRYMFGPVRGGVAIAVVIVSTLFAACTGITGAACVSMGILALPIMIEYKYNKKIATGCIAGSSSLGILIPPSIMLIVMAEQSGETVGRLFAGAIIPGLILSTLFIIYVLYKCWRHPDYGPALSAEQRASVSGKQLMKMILKGLAPPLILILGVLGTIFAGVATPTEAAGVGAFLSIVLMVAYGKFTWKDLYEAVLQTAKAFVVPPVSPVFLWPWVVEMWFQALLWLRVASG